MHSRLRFPPSFARGSRYGLGLAIIGALTTSLCAQNNYATPYTITTLAGSLQGSGSTDGLGTLARFVQPYAVTTDGAGNIFVADSGNHTIRKITAGGSVSTLAGLAGSNNSTDGIGSAARFFSPSGVAVDAQGNVFVADASNHAIRKIAPNQTVTTYAGIPTFSGTVNGPLASARFTTPWGLAFDATGNLFVADLSAGLLRKIDPAGNVSTFASGLSSPRGVAADSAGNLYVAESGSGIIRKISPLGALSTLAGLANSIGSADGTGSTARFNAPGGVAVDAQGNVFVADTGNQIIRKITPAGVVTTLAGSVFSASNEDGIGASARFRLPAGIALRPDGTLYVADTNNSLIRAGVSAATPIANKVGGVTVPALIPAGAAVTEARAFAEQSGGGVIVGVAGSYAARPSGGTTQAIIFPGYTNPQPYNLSYVVRLLANGQPDPAFTSAPGGDGTVNAVVVQADGKILVGGTFTTFNGVLFRNLARLNADGKSDATFNLGSGVDAQVNALALEADGRILVGGAFQTYQGIARPYLLRLNASGAVDASFVPAINGAIDTIAVQPDGKILIGGAFTSAGGASRNRVARLLPGGANDASFDPGGGANDEVVTLRVQGDGAVVAAGDFTNFAGQSRSRIVRLLANGTIDGTFLTSAGANGTVISLGLEAGGNLILGGAFTQINGVTRNRLARLLPSGSLDPAFDPADGANKDVRAVLPRSDGTIFLGGLFDQYQGAAANQVVAIAGTPVATSFVRAPGAITVNLGGTARFLVDAAGAGALTYQWFKDGVALPGAVASILTIPNVATASQGSYTLQVTSSSSSTTTSPAVALTVVAGLPSQIINLSVLTSLDAPGAKFTLGFVLGGVGTSGPKPLLVRAGGPALASFGVGNPLADPQLQFFAGDTLAGQNDNWGGTPALTALTAQVGAFAFLSAGSKDAAFSPDRTAAANSVVVSSADNGTGAVIAEVYDASPVASIAATTPRLLNVSVLKAIAGTGALTAGFVIRGNTTKTVLIRAVGPTLAGFGIGDAMADPKLTLFNGAGAVVAANDNWNGNEALKSIFTTVGAFELQPTTKDAAILVNLAPGSYTATAASANAAAGSAIVEVYEVP